MTDPLIVQPQYTQPNLWVETVTIFDDLEKKSVLRRVPLKRGLNIVWGDSGELPTNTTTPPATLSGHSVGKSSFCRLIRYILGEKTFGHEETEGDIRYAFPNGGVGAVVHVGGIRWAVLRAFMVPADSVAAVDAEIEQLLPLAPKEKPYQDFTQALDNTLLISIPGIKPPDAAPIFRWLNLLSWLARDQEVRYRNLWLWRSSDSDSQVGALQKADALMLIRMVLGLSSPEEDALVRRIEDLEKRYREASESSNRRRAQLDAQLIREFDALTEILADAGRLTDSPEKLFVLGEIGAYVADKKKELDDLTQHRKELNEGVIALHAKKRRFTNAQEQIAAYIAAPQLTTQEDALRKRVRQLASLANEDCDYGNIRYADCEHYQTNAHQWRVEYLAEQAQKRTRRQQPEEKRLAAIRKWTAEKMGIENKLAYLTRQIKLQAARLNQIDQDIAALTALLQRIDYHQQMYNRAAEALKPGTDAAPSATARDLHMELVTAEERLKSLRAGHYLTRGELETLYNQLIQTVLSPQFPGKVHMKPDGDLQFRIGKGDGLSGEAVATLALVFADVAAVLWSIGGHGHHPRFLIHDSPREADLDRAIYDRFLLAMRRIAASLGDDNAPYQYIITTTSAPPETLQSDGTVILPLKAHPHTEMLYRRQLGERDDQYSLPLLDESPAGSEESQ